MFDLYANALYNLSVMEGILKVILLVCLIVLVVKEIRKKEPANKKSSINL